MAAIPARELRNNTAEVLRRVEAGEEIEVHRNSQPIAKIIPLRQRRRWIPATDVIAHLERIRPDRTGWQDDLDEILSQTTDELPW